MSETLSRRFLLLSLCYLNVCCYLLEHILPTSVFVSPIVVGFRMGPLGRTGRCSNAVVRPNEELCFCSDGVVEREQ